MLSIVTLRQDAAASDTASLLTASHTLLAVYNRLWAEYFKDAQPCRTTVEVTRLPTPIAIELKCIATVE